MAAPGSHQCQCHLIEYVNTENCALERVPVQGYKSIRHQVGKHEQHAVPAMAIVFCTITCIKVRIATGVCTTQKHGMSDFLIAASGQIDGHWWC